MILPENPVISAVKDSLTPGGEIYLVGGSVRDILLANELRDYDFVMEGDVFPLAKKVAKSFGYKLSLNKKLLTASFAGAWGSVDFACARKEYYKYPGAMPAAVPASIKEDLKRRDFTINTLLLPLSFGGWGRVRDMLGGREDLKLGLIRFLHENSFRDDPTRILRALRFKNRFGFSLEEKTICCLQRDWPVLMRISPARRFKEWVLICQEDNPCGIIEDIRDMGGWNSFFGQLTYDQKAISDISFLKDDKEISKLRFWHLILLALLASSPRSLNDIALYWGIAKRDRETLELTLQVLEAYDFNSLNRRKAIKIIKTLPPEGAYYIYKFILNWDISWEKLLLNLKEYSLPINGGDLKSLGMEPGPRMGAVLDYLEEKYTEGVYSTKAEALRLAEKIIKEEGIDAF